MTRKPAPFAIFAHGIDGLFLPGRPRQPRFVLARADSPEFAWSRDVHGAERTIGYRTRNPSSTTAGLLSGSDVGVRLKERGVRALLLTVGCAPATKAWAEREGIDLWMTAWRHQRRFEDKLRFDRFCRRHGLPVPARVALRRDTRGHVELAALPAVVQEADSMGGEGTFFAKTPAHVQHLAATGVLGTGSRILVRAHEAGVPYGVTVFVAPGRVQLSALRRQCYAPTAEGAPLAFVGLQWVPTPAEPWVADLRAVLARLGERLHAERYFGFANIDFLHCDDGRVALIECNARMSAATPQLLRHHDLAGGIDLGGLYLDGLRWRVPWPATLTVGPLPATTFAGATLDLLSARTGVVPRLPRAGRWTGTGGRLRWLGADVADPTGAGEFVVVPLAQPGETVEAGQSIATVLASVPLFDRDGVMLPVARTLRAALQEPFDADG